LESIIFSKEDLKCPYYRIGGFAPIVIRSLALTPMWESLIVLIAAIPFWEERRIFP